MSVETKSISKLEKTTSKLGTAMMLGWTFGIGIVGFVLLSAIAYALMTERLTLAVFCALVFFAPLVMTVLWGILVSALSLRRAAADAFPGPAGGKLADRIA
jgi:hypothetical protein